MVLGLNVKEAIYAWYQKNGRHDLPWRQTQDAYKIYLSEIMLQQTQVKTVLERFYFPFLKRFPNLKSVADKLVANSLDRDSITEKSNFLL